MGGGGAPYLVRQALLRTADCVFQVLEDSAIPVAPPFPVQGQEEQKSQNHQDGLGPSVRLSTGVRLMQAAAAPNQRQTRGHGIRGESKVIGTEKERET
jgi:hypothetical protein